MKRYLMLLGITLITLGIGSLLIPISEGQDNVMPFPNGLACQDAIVNEDADQPSWMGIEIGHSTLNDLTEAVERFGYDYDVIEKPEDQTILFLTKLEDIEFESDKPYAVRACLDGKFVVILQILTVHQAEPPKLGSIILEKGVPDAVTWSPNSPGFRLLFWFEKGFMVEVHAPEFRAEGGELSPIEVFQYVYFSPQPIDGYENRWPYNRTSKGPKDLNSIDSLYSRKQDPFRFDNFFATLTAQSEPTITPISSPQLTPSPIDLRSQDLCP